MSSLIKYSWALVTLVMVGGQATCVHGVVENWLSHYHQRNTDTYRGAVYQNYRVYSNFSGTSPVYFTRQISPNGSTYYSYDQFSTYYCSYSSVWQPDSQTRYESTRSGYDRVVNLSLINTHYVKHIAVGDIYDSTGTLVGSNAYNLTQSWWMSPDTWTYAIDSSRNYIATSVLLQLNIWP
ncbi:MAG TPA: hypothetical protein P5186_03750 [Candidatus Paceibacterota bacterium]|nr:hypothetical protein [Verrucomicrobiota bacterium]HRY47141.1 hypothetical protein [Candidatus Paceibacterota bacterium]HSA03450.1 hypothetical protein [Candidatus Paceibacterota bacterium]